MNMYEVPNEIRRHNYILGRIKPFYVDETQQRVLEEYESIIRIQSKGLEGLRRGSGAKRVQTGLADGQLVGVSQEIKWIKDVCARQQNSDAPVLIQAETGCGKELIATCVQRHSWRWNKPFIKVNCSAFPESLFESELFGYVEGAFTGALKKGKKGLFVAADGGTIFLDEISELPISMQAKLLRVIQEQEVTPVGGVEAVPIDVRIIAATNQRLQNLVVEGKFRKDLYFRLNVLPITLSPLRKRKVDIRPLADYFLEKYSARYDVPKSFTEEGYEALESYDWPGNVRELENIIERLIIWGGSERIGREDIIMATHEDMAEGLEWYNEEELTLEEMVEAVERRAIINALQRYGSTRKAAEHLNISQPTLSRRMSKYQIIGPLL